MQLVFGLGTALVTVIGLDLFLLSDYTERAFAWTVRAPATAGFLGAFYLTAGILAGVSFRKRRWLEVRVGVLGVGLFVLLTLMLTLVHLDQLQTRSPHVLTRIVSYAWIAIYALDPLLIAAAWIAQTRSTPSESRGSRLPTWFRLLLLVQGAALLGAGLTLFVAPSSAASFWPWSLAAIDARAIAAWLTGLGLVIAQAAWENAWERISVALDSASVLAVLHLFVLARFHTGLDGGFATAIYIAQVVLLLGVGAFGHFASRASRQRQQRESPRTGAPRPEAL